MGIRIELSKDVQRVVVYNLYHEIKPETHGVAPIIDYPIFDVEQECIMRIFEQLWDDLR